MTESNPTPIPTLEYATPVLPSQLIGAWSKNGQLVTTLSCMLPQNCVKCGQPATQAFLRKYYWHTPWVYVMILFPGLLIYAIVALCIRKTATINYGLCAVHSKSRLKRIGICWLICLIGLGSLVFGIMLVNRFLGRQYENMGVILIISSILLILIAAILSAFIVPAMRPSKMDRDHAWFKGAGPEFLRQLPQA